MRDDSTAYILGSSPSILALTETERLHLHNSPYTLAMNKFMMFWHYIGIIPNDLLLVDMGEVGLYVLSKSLDVLESTRMRGSFFVNSKYIKKYFSYSARGILRGMKWRLNTLAKNGYFVPLRKGSLRPITIVNSRDLSLYERLWSDSIDKPFVNCRGSLTVAINLASVLYPSSKIKLVGVDMVQHTPFYGHDFEQHAVKHRLTLSKKKQQREHMAQKRGLHSTALSLDGSIGGVIHAVSQARELLKSEGVELLCTNSSSLLVSVGNCPYEAIV